MSLFSSRFRFHTSRIRTKVIQGFWTRQPDNRHIARSQIRSLSLSLLKIIRNGCDVINRSSPVFLSHSVSCDPSGKRFARHTRSNLLGSLHAICVAPTKCGMSCGVLSLLRRYVVKATPTNYSTSRDKFFQIVRSGPSQLLGEHGRSDQPEHFAQTALSKSIGSRF